MGLLISLPISDKNSVIIYQNTINSETNKQLSNTTTRNETASNQHKANSSVCRYLTF